MSETICPYTGLRSFSEEESLYFKGRDGQIARLTQQLEEKKFLMLTGASGDGKSSLIFAGLIPHARAGFFKAQYLNWKVVSFRPERAPLKNMAKGVAAALQLEDAGVVENELSHGFSSLIDIYKSTSTFVDQRDSSFTNASEAEREIMGREAGNLLIIVDQFEEFFTNPENFPGGVPSQDARLVLNILLEAVKIALRDNLPIYVVFTMRSDYIGQCAAFRGLPEFIGFSQFFVPRLQRRELQQVIEEPAVLSGNRISKRLVDRLIYDLDDTEDHLPILQHVLKEMWKTADEGREEIDLIHYAMVGGMPADQLPAEDKARFQKWLSRVPENEKEFLKSPRLSNVLDIHATRLYTQAADAYNKTHSDKISDKDAKFILAITFACLTRIDENRAVRSRMTLAEITGIINLPHVTTRVVDDVLRSFREPGNTLVRPFIDENGLNKELDPDSVLDITHEALIRNWKLLNRWATKEFEYYNTYLDFKKQLQRWIDNGKSSNFLLPIGPLTYFEKWFRESRPNAWWIKRYDLAEGNEKDKLEQAHATLEVSNRFLKKSEARLVLTRLFMKYGAGRIAILAAVFMVLLVGGVFGYRWWIQRNQSVVNRVLAEGENLLQVREASIYNKVGFLYMAERLEPGHLMDALEATPDIQDRINTSVYLSSFIFQVDKYSLPPLFFKTMSIADSISRMQAAPDISSVQETDRYIAGLNDLINIETDYLYFHSDPVIQKRLDQQVKRLSEILFSMLTKGDPSTQWDKKILHIGITNSINWKGFSTDSLSQLIAGLSPLEGNDSAKIRFEQLFPKNETIQVALEQRVTHNGGYDMLAHLYATQGNANKAIQCGDTLVKYQSDYEGLANNSRNVLATFFLYDQAAAAKAGVDLYAERTKMRSSEYMKMFAMVAGMFDITMTHRVIKNGNLNPNLTLLNGARLDKVYEVFRATIVDNYKNPAERDFALALVYKQQGAVLSKKMLERERVVDTLRVNTLFRKAVTLYNTLPETFIKEPLAVTVYEPGSGAVEVRIPRYRIFGYPDYFNTYINRYYYLFIPYYSDAFFKFMHQHHLVEKWYHTTEDYAMLAQWVGHSFFLKDAMAPFSGINVNYINFPSIDRPVLDVVDSLIAHSGFERKIDNPWVRLIKINEFLSQNKTDLAVKELDKIDIGHMASLRRHFYETVSLSNYITHTASALVQAGLTDRASKFVSRQKEPQSRQVMFSQLGIAAFEKGMTDQAEAYLDSAQQQVRKVVITEAVYRAYWDVRNQMVRLVVQLRGKEGRREVLELTGDMGDKKTFGIANAVRMYASLGDYYEAETVIPVLTNADDRLILFTEIMFVELQKRKSLENDPWKTQDELIVRMQNFVLYPAELF